MLLLLHLLLNHVVQDRKKSTFSFPFPLVNSSYFGLPHFIVLMKPNRLVPPSSRSVQQLVALNEDPGLSPLKVVCRQFSGPWVSITRQIGVHIQLGICIWISCAFNKAEDIFAVLRIKDLRLTLFLVSKCQPFCCMSMIFFKCLQ